MTSKSSINLKGNLSLKIYIGSLLIMFFPALYYSLFINNFPTKVKSVYSFGLSVSAHSNSIKSRYIEINIGLSDAQKYVSYKKLV